MALPAVVVSVRVPVTTAYVPVIAFPAASFTVTENTEAVVAPAAMYALAVVAVIEAGFVSENVSVSVPRTVPVTDPTIVIVVAPAVPSAKTRM